MAKIVRLTESDLTRLVRRVIKEQQTTTNRGPVGSQINFMTKDNTKYSGTIEKIYTPSGTEMNRTGYNQILQVNFVGKGRHEIGFKCSTKQLIGISLVGGYGVLHTESGLEEGLGNNCPKK